MHSVRRLLRVLVYSVPLCPHRMTDKSTPPTLTPQVPNYKVSPHLCLLCACACSIIWSRWTLPVFVCFFEMSIYKLVYTIQYTVFHIRMFLLIDNQQINKWNSKNKQINPDGKLQMIARMIKNNTDQNIMAPLHRLLPNGAAWMCSSEK